MEKITNNLQEIIETEIVSRLNKQIDYFTYNNKAFSYIDKVKDRARAKTIAIFYLEKLKECIPKSEISAT
jgi:hypothetical protein